ncbi:hypothetical protein [Streptomyces phaeochromogenes]|uniref:hypothetical protein n=1 Tax=Streptomyces phaeochromogenes TaxID=1923 RepID=UPI0033C15B8D
MSTRSIARMARMRTAAGPEKPPEGATDLASIIPTDVLGFYTGALALLIGMLEDEPLSDYLPLRWCLYGGGIAATGIAILIAYITDKSEQSDEERKWPFLETAFSVTAFAFWGLVIPGSPLYVFLEGPTLGITTGVLAAVGALLVKVVFEPFLKTPVKQV